MKFKQTIKHIFTYLNDQSVDFRIRMMFFLEYASFFACLIGTIFMICLNQPIESMFPNIVLFVTSFISLYISHKMKKYDLAAGLMIIGCANIAVPWMFFSAGGNDSGMLLWFIFSVAVTCLMAGKKVRFLIAGFTIIEYLACIVIGHYYPEYVTPLVGKNAVFVDEVQSFIVVSVFLALMLTIYIRTYENQRLKLEEKSEELRNMMQTDALTGVFNRHAYYGETNTYRDSSRDLGLVLVAMDVNGLKKVNDLLGHAAGDDYIRAASKVIVQSLGQYGHIFRTGGDEFMALLHCSANEAKCFEERINENIAKLDNSWTEKMAIAIGVVCWEDEPHSDFSSIEKIADKRMYENKAAYYRKNGIDRRR